MKTAKFFFTVLVRSLITFILILALISPWIHNYTYVDLVLGITFVLIGSIGSACGYSAVMRSHGE